MKNIPTVYRVRLWNGNSGKISQRFFFRDPVAIGCDSKSDLRISGLPQLYGRLDFAREKLHEIGREEAVEAKEGSLVSVGPHVIQWTRMKLITKTTLFGAGSFVFVVIVLFSTWLFSDLKVELNCSSFDERLANGYWGLSGLEPTQRTFVRDLKERRKDFSRAVQKKEWVRARGTLNEMEKLFAQFQIDRRCGAYAALDDLELKLSVSLIRDAIGSKNFHAAASELGRWSHITDVPKLNAMRQRLTREAYRIYFHGYRLEESEIERAAELMATAREICRLANLDQDCFRSRPQAQRGMF